MKFFTSALTRQITEAVWISRWGEDSLLNSKGEYNRCKIGRLALGDEGNRKVDKPGEEKTTRENVNTEETSIEEWERR